MQNFKRLLLNPVFIFIVAGIIGITVLVKRNNINPFTVPLINVNDQKTTLSQYLQKKPILLEFWASWCPHCQNEVAILNEFSVKHPQVQILAIKIDDDSYSQNSVFATAKYTILKAQNNSSSLMSRFGNSMGAVPYIVFLDSNGKTLDTVAGEASLHDLENILIKLKW